MKVLFVGDIHNHQKIFEDINRLDNKYKFDRIICTGDYVDDWLTNNHDSLKTLEKIFELKRNNPDKYTLLIGNHELSYLGFPCSGHMIELEDIIEQKLKENIDFLEYYTEVDLDNKTYVCTHSGITNDYIYNMLDKSGNWKQSLNELQKDKLKNLEYLKCCSYRRGGRDNCSSFVWADRMEHIESLENNEPIIKYQIFGHSPVKTISNITKNNYNYYCIDTHSTYRDGMQYGDNSYLIYDNGFKVEY